MSEKQREKSDEGFWNEQDESDEDFETLLGISKVKSEPEIKKYNDKENYTSMSSIPVTIKNSDTVNQFTEPTNNLLMKEEELKDFNEDDQAHFITNQMSTSEIQSQIDAQSFKILPADKMDFLWDDEDDEDVFIKPQSIISTFVEKNLVNNNQNEDFVNTFKETSGFDDSEFGSLDELLQNDNFDIPLTNLVENRKDDLFISDEINDEPTHKDDIFAKSNILPVLDDVDRAFYRDHFDFSKNNQQEKSDLKCSNLLKTNLWNVPESKTTSNKFDFSSQIPRVHFLNRFVLTYSIIKQMRRNQQGEYIEKEVNVVNTFEYCLSPMLNSSLSVDISQIDNDYKQIKKILELKDPHVDSICDVLKAKNVFYSQNSYTESYDSSDINILIDLALGNKEMAVEYACMKSMWSFALLCSNNKPDIIKKFLSQVCKKEMVDLALSVFIVDRSKNVEIPSNWSEYLKHIFRLPFGDAHMKLIQRLYNEDRNNLYVFLVSLHLLKIVNIGDFIEYYSRNFHFLNILLFLEKKSFVKNIDLIIYQYIKILCDFDKSAAEEIYKSNKKRFNSEVQTALDRTFNVAGWGFGLKEVINFGISKILNVEDETITTTAPREKKQNVPIINRNLSKSFNVPRTNTSIQMNMNTHHSQVISHNKTYSANDVEQSFEKMKIDGLEIDNLAECNNTCQNDTIEEVAINNEHTLDTKHKSKSVIINNEKSIYSDQQHAKSFADIMDLEKPRKEQTTEDDTSLFLSKYNIDDDDAGLKKFTEEKKEEHSSSFFSMFNFFKKPSYKVDIQASDDIKYDPMTKKWISGSAQSAPQEAVKATQKSIPLPSKGKSQSKSSVDVRNMSLYANKKASASGNIPGFKKKNDKM